MTKLNLAYNLYVINILLLIRKIDNDYTTLTYICLEQYECDWRREREEALNKTRVWFIFLVKHPETIEFMSIYNSKKWSCG